MSDPICEIEELTSPGWYETYLSVPSRSSREVLQETASHNVTSGDDDGEVTTLDALPSPVEGLGDDSPSIFRRQPHDDESLLRSQLSFISVATTSSSVSKDTVDRKSDLIKVSILELCNLVEETDLLRHARIVSCSTYTCWSFIVIHRFVVLTLRRSDRADTFVRIDRRPSSRSRLFQGVGVTPSNDEATLGSRLSQLINFSTDKLEAEQVFTDPKFTVESLTDILRIIWRASPRYTLVSKNCWMLASFLQDLLGSVGGGKLVQGKLTHMGLARETRLRVKGKMERICRILLPETMMTALREVKLGLKIEKGALAEVMTILQFKDIWHSADDIVIRDLDMAIELMDPLLFVVGFLPPKHTPEDHHITSAAVTLARSVRVHEPGKHEEALADGLLSRDGRRRRTLETIEERVELRRQLYLREPEKHADILARELCLYSQVLFGFGLLDRICDIQEEGLTLLRHCHRLNPAMHEEVLIEELFWFGRFLCELELYDKAYDIQAEGITLSGQLDLREPNKHYELWARQLHESAFGRKIVGGSRLEGDAPPVEFRRIPEQTQPGSESPLHRYIEARDAYLAEGLKLRRHVHLREPGKHEEQLMWELRSYGVCLLQSRLYDQACGVEGECVELRRRLRLCEPGKHDEDLIRELSSYGFSLAQCGLYDQACYAHAEAVQLRRELHLHEPGRYDVCLIRELGFYRESLLPFGLYAQACEVEAELVELRRGLRICEPGKHEEHLIVDLRMHGVFLRQCGFFDKACDADEEGVQLRRELRLREPEKLDEVLLGDLRYHALALLQYGFYDKARDAQAEIIDLRRQLRSREPDKHDEDLASELLWYSVTLQSFGSFEEAYNVREESVNLWRDLFSRSDSHDSEPLLFPNLQDILRAHEQFLRAVGRPAQADSIEGEISNLIALEQLPMRYLE